MKRITIAVIMVLCVGCDPPKDLKDPSVIQLTTEIPAEFGNRFAIVEVARFDDDFAYNKARRVYILTDTKTGREYVGISGIGISELGKHENGDDTVKDER